MSDKADWKSEQWLREQYHGKAKSMQDIADMVDVSISQVHKNIHKHDIETRQNKLAKDHPAKDREKLVKLHYDQKKTVLQIAEHFDVSRSTIKRLLDRYDIKRLYRHELTDDANSFFHYTDKSGYIKIGVSGIEKTTTKLHLLQMCVKHDPHVVFHPDIVIHHKNGLRWDNRSENLQFMTNSSHSKHHIENGGHNVREWQKRQGEKAEANK